MILLHKYSYFISNSIEGQTSLQYSVDLGFNLKRN